MDPLERLWEDHPPEEWRRQALERALLFDIITLYNDGATSEEIMAALDVSPDMP